MLLCRSACYFACYSAVLLCCASRPFAVLLTLRAVRERCARSKKKGAPIQKGRPFSNRQYQKSAAIQKWAGLFNNSCWAAVPSSHSCCRRQGAAATSVVAGTCSMADWRIRSRSACRVQTYCVWHTLLCVGCSK